MNGSKLIFLVLCTLYLVPCTVFAKRIEPIQFHVLNVGYGQAIHVQVGYRNYLIDTGPREAASTVINHLAENGTTRLEGIFITHTHQDHAGALLNIIKQIHTERVVWNEMPSDKPEINEAFQDVDGITKLDYFGHGDQIQIGEVTFIRALASTFEEAGLNDNSLVFQIKHHKTNILVGADAGPKRQANLVSLETETLANIHIFVWPHHGDILSKDFIQNLSKAEHCIVSVGNNEYGLPRAGLDAQTNQVCNNVHSTNKDGTVSFQIGKKISTKKKPLSDLEKDPFRY